MSTPDISLPDLEEIVKQSSAETSETDEGGGGSGYRVILYNDEWHSTEEVVLQLQKATGYSIERCAAIMIEAHFQGRAVCYQGARAKCHRVAKVLREIRLQCEVDCD